MAVDSLRITPLGALVLGRDPTELVLAALLLVALVPATAIDLRRRRIPDAITVPAGLVAIVLGTALDPAGEAGRLLAAAGGGLFLLMPALVQPDGMGMGDVKLAAVLGLCLGPAVAVALAAALLVGLALGAALTVRDGMARARRATIAFGPCLAAGGIVAVVVGDPLVGAYLAVL